MKNNEPDKVVIGLMFLVVVMVAVPLVAISQREPAEEQPSATVLAPATAVETAEKLRKQILQNNDLIAIWTGLHSNLTAFAAANAEMSRRVQSTEIEKRAEEWRVQINKCETNLVALSDSNLECSIRFEKLATPDEWRDEFPIYRPVRFNGAWSFYRVSSRTGTDWNARK
jgi:hypothetical protein